MPKQEKYSSLHSDLLVPWATKSMGEYKPDKYPERFDPKEKTVITRLSQLGIDVNEVENRLGKKINEITEHEYNELVAAAININYETVIGTVFDKHIFNVPRNPDIETRFKQL